MTWLILKTDHAKEFAVAEALTALGHECWVPTYVCEVRERKVMGPGITVWVRKPVDRPLMASVLLADALVAASPLPSVRHLRGYWTDAFELPRLVPTGQLATFRARVEEVNTAERARIKKASIGKRKAKKIVKLDPSLAEELKRMLFGSAAMEDAA